MAEANGGRTHQAQGNLSFTGFEDRDLHRQTFASDKFNNKHSYNSTCSCDTLGF